MLKEREQKVLDFMKQEVGEKGYPPTVREICAALGIKSTSTVHKPPSGVWRRVLFVPSSLPPIPVTYGSRKERLFLSLRAGFNLSNFVLVIISYDIRWRKQYIC